MQQDVQSRGGGSKTAAAGETKTKLAVRTGGDGQDARHDSPEGCARTKPRSKPPQRRRTKRIATACSGRSGSSLCGKIDPNIALTHAHRGEEADHCGGAQSHIHGRMRQLRSQSCGRTVFFLRSASSSLLFHNFSDLFSTLSKRYVGASTSRLIL